MDEYLKTNLKRWNETTQVHFKSKEYDLESFMKGRNSLYSLELEALGDVSGKSLLHLQCQFGMDTLSWARLGATVTGVDFSDVAINLASDINNELQLPARFLNSNIYDLPDILDEQFDIVFTSYGVLTWLPDLKKWGKIVSRYLKPGGIFFIAEFHPFSMVFDEEHSSELVYKYPYFHSEVPMHFKSEYTYTDSEKTIENVDAYEWQHSFADIITALLDAGLTIIEVKEYPFTNFGHFPFVKKCKDRYWRVKNNRFEIPLMFSLKATKK
ncbi:MAG: methyltransferase domain-containing protein [Candidatus Heimdallarchaeota archaeon]